MRMIKKKMPLEDATVIQIPFAQDEELNMEDIIGLVAETVGEGGVLEMNDEAEMPCGCHCCSHEPMFRVSHPLFHGQVPEIEKVIYNKPATIIFWKDGTKTVVKCSSADTYDPEIGFEKAILTKMFGRSGLRHLYKDYSAEKYAVPEPMFVLGEIPRDEPEEEQEEKPVAKPKTTKKTTKSATKKSTKKTAEKEGE